MATLKVGPKFFRKERDNLYSNWPVAFWREMLQNSIDAGARSIMIDISKSGSRCVCQIADDGCGMTRKVIEDKFFVLGETTKEDEDSVGGFGRARILTCFAMEEYSFSTGNLSVTGSGADYEIIEKPDQLVDGCDFRIAIGDKDEDDMRDGLVHVLSRSQLDCDVTINGERWTNWMHRLRQTRDLDCGGVYVNKSQPSNSRIIVRVKGLFMFGIYTTSTAQVIVEIDPKKSRKVLTVNRDGMHSDYQENVEKFLTEIAVDRQSALRSKPRHTTLFRGTGFFTASGKVVRHAERRNAGYVPASRPVDKVTHEVIEGASYCADLPSIYINDDATKPKVRKVIPNFNPKNWTHAIKRTRGTEQKWRKGATYLKLLMVWKTCCEEAVRALLEDEKEGFSWLVGWSFCDDRLAECCPIEDGSAYALCLNPVDENGNLRYKVSSRADRMALMALAKHEVAHVRKSLHDEDYSSVHTDIDARFDPWEAMRRLKTAISATN